MFQRIHFFVDDNEDLRKYIRMTFGDSYQVVDVESAEAALKYLKEGGICDIVVSRCHDAGNARR